MAEQPKKDMLTAAMGAVWESITTPGGSSGVVKTFATVMGLLAVPISFLLFETGANLHVMVMAALWCGLAVSMWWVWTVQQKVEATEGTFSAGKPDAGKADSGKADAGKADAGKADAGKADAGKADAGKAAEGETPAADEAAVADGADREDEVAEVSALPADPAVASPPSVRRRRRKAE